jgi:hypothetical protein
LVGLGCLVLAGCAAQPAAVTPAEAVAQLRTGRPLLTCREACLVEWQRAEPQAAQLAVGARWADLAALALRIGYQDDLSLYYLGRAAEGLGYPRAAASYYRQSSALSGTSISCRNLSRMCGGMIFPRAALLRLAALERNLKRSRLQRTGPAPQEPEMPVSARGEAEAPAPSPASSPGGPAPSEYIEPPPAMR